MKAVLLAAGAGERLMPITATRPKHLIKVGGKPILQYCLEAVKIAGINEAIIVTHYMGEEIRNYFGDGAKPGSVCCARQHHVAQFVRHELFDQRRRSEAGPTVAGHCGGVAAADRDEVVAAAD